MNTCLLHKQMLVLLHAGPVVSPHDVTQLFKRQGSGRENFRTANWFVGYGEDSHS